MPVLAVDVGGSHVKALLEGEAERRRFASGRDITARQMVDGVLAAVAGWSFDRVSVGIRMGRKARVEAVSGCDIAEKRSNLVVLMRKLFDAVLSWGEKLVYNGTKDDSLPPTVLHALDAYLAESNSKLLVVLRRRDEREKESQKPSRSAMLMECFEPQA